ncbi:MAG: zinc-binding dehydrogenase [Candidatus Acidiferrales bacterium]
MERKSKLAIAIATAVLAVVGATIIYAQDHAQEHAQDKYSLISPGGIAFSDFRGYEDWVAASSARVDGTLKVIVSNPTMITALASLEMLDVARGHRVVVMGATGGVGGYAVQMARSMGAHVIATVRGDADEAKRLGAEEVYDTKAGDVIAAIHKAHPDGVDAVFDLVNGKDAIGRDAEILKPGGKLVSTIYAADEKWFAERKITAHNIAGLTNPLSNTEGLTRVARMMADGVITARITATVELEKAGEIIEKLKKGGLRGKALIRVS